MSLIWVGEVEHLDREVVGGKAHSLNVMTALGLPVPPAFVLSSELCGRYHASGKRLSDALVEEVRVAVTELERRLGRTFGGGARPLLVSVRSGAARSMPGMMDTVLNLGMNDGVERALAALTDDPGYAADTHRRFREQYGKVVGSAPADDVWEQLFAAVEAVFDSWMSPRAVAYREHHGIPSTGGTAVTIQAMVFGNLDDKSGTGVLFSRNPLTGDREPYGEWLPGGQGEDVVSGRFDPLPLSTLADQFPEVHHELLEAARQLEAHGKDVQDIEFTVEAGALWMLQSRSAKRAPDAAIRLAVVLQDEGILSVEQALNILTPSQLVAVSLPRVAPEAKQAAVLLAKGEPACPGVAIGRVVLEVEEAEDLAAEGGRVVLARPTTNPDDISGMIVASAILTEVGGATSHAAVVSRELGVPCIVGCGIGALAHLAGREVTVDGGNGEVYEGALPLAPVTEADNPALARVAGWMRDRAGRVDGALTDLLVQAQESIMSESAAETLRGLPTGNKVT